MQSRFTFLEDDYPKLANYGRKAEDCSDSDPNICLLNLGRMAEFIARELCARNNIPAEGGTENLSRKLLDAGTITEEISRKITTLSEIKHDAANDGYDSEMACSRLMDSAEELCRWFMSYHGGGKFAFLADIFPENSPAPPLACLAEYGREAERNLSTNTRYSFICLGDIGEAVTDILLERDGIRPDKNTGQHDRINMLFNIVGMSNKDKIDILHRLRQTRNDAVHKRYESAEEGRQLIGEALELCKWMFLFVMSEGDFVRGVITESGNDGLGVMVGEIPASVPASEIPDDKAVYVAGSYPVGERHIFRAKGNDGQQITLSMSQANADPWTNTARRYGRYTEGQLLNARITAITENFGMTAEIGDGYEVLEARIPESEYSLTEKYKAGDIARASVKWLSPKEYPYIILSIRDAEESSKPDKWAGNDDSHERETKNEAMTDKDFRAFCKSARYEEILQALDEGANYDAKNSSGVTALMTAAEFNKDSRVVKALVEAGADIQARDNDGRTVADYAVRNPNLEGTEILARLLEGNAHEDFAGDLGSETLAENLTDASQDEQSPEIEADIAQPDTMPGASSEPETLTEDFAQPTQDEASPENEADIAQPETLPGDSVEPETLTGNFTDSQDEASQEIDTDIAQSETLPGDSVESETLSENFTQATQDETSQEIEADIAQPDILPGDSSQPETLTEDFTQATQDEPLPGNYTDIAQPDIPTGDSSEPDTLTEDFTQATQDEPLPEIDADIAQPETLPGDSLEPDTLTEDFSQDAQDEPSSEIDTDIAQPDILPGDSVEPETSQEIEADTAQPDTLPGDASQPETLTENFTQDSRDEPSPEIDTDIAQPDTLPGVSSELETLTEDFTQATQDETSQEIEADTTQPETDQPPSDSDFLELCQNGTEDDIIHAIEAGANPNAVTQHGTTALMYSAMRQPGHVTEALLRAGALIDAANDKGNTALMLAVMYRKHDNIDILLRKGAGVIAENKEGKTVIEYARENLSTEAGWGYLHHIKRKARNILADMCKVEGHENEADIMRLIGHHASVNATRGNKHDTTLMYAARNKSASVIRALLERGADVNATNLNGENALMWAARYNDEEAVCAILDGGADISAKDGEDNTALHYAQENPNIHDSDILTRLGAETEPEYDDDDTPPAYEIEAPENSDHDDEEDRPLTQEQEEESRRVLRMTMQKDFLKICRSGAEDDITQAVNAGVNVNVTNRTASTALMFAAQSNTAGAIDILIQAGADVNAQDDNGNTALIYAASYNTDDVVDVLINAGADSGITNNAGHKASDYARHNYRLADTDAVKRLEA
ncbi:MAG: ankyrin repeat domain-containing protein [Synergistaceae bacterium]|nr:ankyrin repeat domain-containing protein [Synergistaceae bacterium]